MVAVLIPLVEVLHTLCKYTSVLFASYLAYTYTSLFMVTIPCICVRSKVIPGFVVVVIDHANLNHQLSRYTSNIYLDLNFLKNKSTTLEHTFSISIS